MADKNVYVITGGAGGIGLAAAKQFTDGRVIMSDFNAPAFENGHDVLT